MIMVNPAAGYGLRISDSREFNEFSAGPKVQ